VALRAAGEEALEEVQRLDRLLSLYRPDSEIGRVNARAYGHPVRVSPPVFRLLDTARQLSHATSGAFDITVGPLLRCWGLMGGKGRVPSDDELAAAHACAGMDLVHLDPERFTVGFARKGVMLDLGAIGKGYAVEKAAELLKDAGVTSAFLHGGTSTMCALGAPPGQEAWKVTLELPGPGSGGALSPRTAHGDFEPAASSAGFLTGPAPAPADWKVGVTISQFMEGAQPDAPAAASVPAAVVSLRDEALSVSAVWGKSFFAEGKTYGHVIDPRSGCPAQAAIMAAVALPSATETDALSTALMTLGSAGHIVVRQLRPAARTFTVEALQGQVHCQGHGITPLLPEVFSH
jgi:thiamine biosynthesis lipoprotein